MMSLISRLGATRPIAGQSPSSPGQGGVAGTPAGTSSDNSGGPGGQSPSLEARLQAAEEQVRTLSSFQSHFNHELRSDLTAILGFVGPMVEAAKGGAGGQDLSKLQTVEHAAAHMQALVEGARALVGLEVGKINVQLAPARFEDIVGDVTRSGNSVAIRRGNQIKLDQLGRLGLVMVDANKVRQILAALVSNANKFTSGGVIEMVSDRITAADGDWIEVSVADTGVGIAKDDLEKVFVEFGLARPNIRGEREGTRMSLSISRRLARLLGGDITVCSDLGVGATFTVRLPYVPAPAA